jgi:hypothetical protein
MGLAWDSLFIPFISGVSSIGKSIGKQNYFRKSGK